VLVDNYIVIWPEEARAVETGTRPEATGIFLIAATAFGGVVTDTRLTGGWD
jgi:hypothetical protein